VTLSYGLALLLADTDGTATATGGLGVLTAHTQTPVVTETAVGADTLETLEILTDLAVEGVGDDLGVLAVGDVALSVQEPCGDLVLGGVLEDGDHTLEFFGGELTGAARVVILALHSLRTPFCAVLNSRGYRCKFMYPMFGRRTAWRGQHRPSCRPSWSNGDQHP